MIASNAGECHELLTSLTRQHKGDRVRLAPNARASRLDWVGIDLDYRTGALTVVLRVADPDGTITEQSFDARRVSLDMDTLRVDDTPVLFLAPLPDGN